MMQLSPPVFDASAFLANAGLGRRIVQLEPRETFFCQGDPADSVLYLQKGRAKVTVVSAVGKEATITIVTAGEFIGQGALAAVPGLRLSTATAITPCTALKIARDEMARVMHEQPEFSDLFMKFLLTHSMRIQSDLVDQTLQLQRKAAGENPALDGGVWRAGQAGNADSQNLSGDSGGDDWHYPLPRQLLHEPLSRAWIYRLQGPHSCAQVAAECDFARSIA